MSVSNAFWFLLVGGLFILIGMATPYIRKVPATSSMVYLCVGLIIGPTGLGLFHFNPLKQAALLEILTEVAVLISLFAAGVKMPVPVRLATWGNPLRLAFLSMSCSVGLVALFGYYVLQLPVGVAVLLGAITAPTDPVLASDVQVRHPGDQDQLRFALTSEAGMNDGSAFPFVMLGLGLLGLHNLGEQGVRWVLVDVLWATTAGIVIGTAAGYALAKATRKLRKHQSTSSGLLDDFLGLGLIATVYGLSLAANAWGFLAVFAAGVMLRQTEHRAAGVPSEVGGPPAGPGEAVAGGPEYQVSAASLVFKEHLERISEVVLILIIGGSLFIDSWSWRAVGFAAFLFCFARPLSVMIGLWGTDTSIRVRALAGWLGVRGIGSLYYLVYAIQHGLPETEALTLIHFVLVVVTLSIIIHGVSVKPVLRRFTPRNPGLSMPGKYPQQLSPSPATAYQLQQATFSFRLRH